MTTTTIELSDEFETVEVHLFADEHIGDANCDLKRLKERIEHVKNTPNAICVLNGDIVDYASRSSISDIETRKYNIMEQLEVATELFKDIAPKIACITSGNHEARSYKKEGIDFSKVFANAIGRSDCYAPSSAIVFVQFGKGKNHGRGVTNKRIFSMFVSHGTGGGRKEGAKANALADMASIVDTDIYIHSHAHLPMVLKEDYFRVSMNTRKVQKVTKLFVNTASNLDYGGYGATALFKPAAKDTPIIYLQANPKKATAVL